MLMKSIVNVITQYSEALIALTTSLPGGTWTYGPNKWHTHEQDSDIDLPSQPVCTIYYDYWSFKNAAGTKVNTVLLSPSITLASSANTAFIVYCEQARKRKAPGTETWDYKLENL